MFIFEAAKDGQLEELKKIIEKKPKSIMAKDKNGRTALHYAAKHGQLEIVKYLIEKNNDQHSNLINIKDNVGKTAFYYAWIENRLDIIEYFLNVDHNLINSLDSLDSLENPPLHFAIDRENVDAIELLLAANLDVIKIIDTKGRTALHYAMIRYQTMEDSPYQHQRLVNLFTIIEFLLSANSNITNVKDNYGKTPFHYAIEFNQSNILKKLLEASTAAIIELNDAIINNQSNILNCFLNTTRDVYIAACYAAIKYNQLVSLTFLFNHGKHFNITTARDESENTLLHYAVNSKNIEAVKIILETYPKIIGAGNHLRKTALHYAVENQQLEMVALLMDASPRTATCISDDSGKTPLQHAIIGNKLEIVKTMIKSQPNIITDPGNGRHEETSLYYAVKCNKLEVVKILISARPNVIHIPNYNGLTPLWIAIKEGFYAIRDVLIKSGANIFYIKSPFAQTPFDLQQSKLPNLTLEQKSALSDDNKQAISNWNYFLRQNPPEDDSTEDTSSDEVSSDKAIKIWKNNFTREISYNNAHALDNSIFSDRNLWKQRQQAQKIESANIIDLSV